MASPVEQLQHLAARSAAIAISDLLEAMLRPEEQLELCREAFRIVMSAIAEYEANKAKLN